MRSYTWVCLAATGAALAGCGSSGSGSSGSATAAATKTVDSSQVEQGIKTSLSTSSVQVTKSSCPNDVQSKKGAKFTCSVTFSNGATGKVEVTETSLNKFSYSLKSGSVQVPGSTVDASLEKSLAAQGIPSATVDCPANIVVKVGTTVTCNVTGANGVATSQVTFTFSNAEGGVDQSSVKTS